MRKRVTSAAAGPERQDRRLVAGHHGHEHRDLTLKPVASVKVSQDLSAIGRVGQVARTRGEQPHPFRIGERIELGQQDGCPCRRHNGQYAAAVHPQTIT